MSAALLTSSSWTANQLAFTSSAIGSGSFEGRSDRLSGERYSRRGVTGRASDVRFGILTLETAAVGLEAFGTACSRTPQPQSQPSRGPSLAGLKPKAASSDAGGWRAARWFLDRSGPSSWLRGCAADAAAPCCLPESLSVSSSRLLGHLSFSATARGRGMPHQRARHGTSIAVGLAYAFIGVVPRSSLLDCLAVCLSVYC